jgi:hypothetical protein
MKLKVEINSWISEIPCKFRHVGSVYCIGRRSQCPHGLSHELSSPSRTLGSWVRIQLKARMSVWVYSVFVLFCVQVATLRRVDHQSNDSYRLRTD